MKSCSECKGAMKELEGKTPEGVGYKYYKCTKCGDEVLSLNQLHSVASQYRAIKNYHVKLSKWGLSLGLRIPKELAKKYKFKNNEEVVMLAEENGIKVIPA